MSKNGLLSAGRFATTKSLPEKRSLLPQVHPLPLFRKKRQLKPLKLKLAPRAAVKPALRPARLLVAVRQLRLFQKKVLNADAKVPQNDEVGLLRGYRKVQRDL